MKINMLSIIIFILTTFSYSINAATPEQCYAYFTELVRSSSFDFSQWKLKPKSVNLIIDEDNDDYIRAKLVIDTDGTGTIGWVYFDKKNNALYDVTLDPNSSTKLNFNNEYLKAQKKCLKGEEIYQVEKSGRVYLMEKTEQGFIRTKIFIISGDYVSVIETKENNSFIHYQLKNNTIVTGWVKSGTLRKIDFVDSW
ncbi:TPA: hypothetical protein SMT55_000292 [Proteus mirabilis]|nr:hypothetical protein [Proteus mirabilis]HEK2722723.1 hypothetical protein [Proteus mirabilis]